MNITFMEPSSPNGDSLVQKEPFLMSSIRSSSTTAAELVTLLGRVRSNGVSTALLPILAEVLLALQDNLTEVSEHKKRKLGRLSRLRGGGGGGGGVLNLEELNHLSQLDLLLLTTSYKVEQGLCVEELLSNDGIGLAEGTDAHGPRIDSHHVEHTVHRGNETRAFPIEAEILTMEQDKVQLCPEDSLSVLRPCLCKTGHRCWRLTQDRSGNPPPWVGRAAASRRQPSCIYRRQGDRR